MADRVRTIGVGVIGTGFIGKAHSIAYSAVSSVFGAGLRPTLEIVCDLWIGEVVAVTLNRLWSSDH